MPPLPPHTIVLIEKPVTADVQAIAAPLQAYNNESGPPAHPLPVALAIQSPEGNILGGLWGQCIYGWLHVDFLVVPPELRRTGIGTRLMQQAEAIAIAHGCTGVWLSTLAFQARPFYEKLGYTKFGQLDDFPPGSPHFFLSKRLQTKKQKPQV